MARRDAGPSRSASRSSRRPAGDRTVRLVRAPGSLPDGLAARPLPRARVAQRRQWTDAPGDRRSGGGGREARSRARGCRHARGKSHQARHGRDHLEERGDGGSRPSADGGRTEPPRDRGSAGRTGSARRAEPRHQRGIGEPFPNGSRRGPPDRGHRHPVGRRSPRGAVADRSKRRGGAPRGPRGHPRRARGTPVDPSIGRAAGPGSHRAARANMVR